MKELRIGLIGCGFMGRAHSNAYRKVNNFFDLEYKPVLKAVCARTEANAAAFTKKWGYESVETDWRKLLAREDIDAVDICTPNNTHAEIAIAAAKAGKMILCEKPLSMDGPEGVAMVKAVEKAKVPNMVWYNYRRVPAVTLAKRLIEEGRLGKIFHYRAKFLQDWTISPDLPQGGAGLWRLDVKAAGSGVTGDLLAHSIDTAIWLNGSIESVAAATARSPRSRAHATRAGTRRFTRSKSTARKRRSSRLRNRHGLKPRRPRRKERGNNLALRNSKQLKIRLTDARFCLSSQCHINHKLITSMAKIVPLISSGVVRRVGVASAVGAHDRTEILGFFGCGQQQVTTADAGMIGNEKHFALQR